MTGVCSKSIDAAGWRQWQVDADVFAVQSYWEDLPVDPYVTDGSRRRRYAVGQLTNGALSILPEEPHLQAPAYNRLFGGIHRHLAPIATGFFNEPVLCQTLAEACAVLSVHRLRWRLQFHQFRILAPGEPTPEGIHRDGADFVLMVLIARHGVTGAETRLYGPQTDDTLACLTLKRSGQALIVDDERVRHFVTPVETRPGHVGAAYRDTLVATFHAERALA